MEIVHGNGQQATAYFSTLWSYIISVSTKTQENELLDLSVQAQDYNFSVQVQDFNLSFQMHD